ncbi:PaaI family thioesterase [Oceanicoccus sp. KOV_DT_Chl]|uniref:PaaI family thioesterase n=1 Tax=Oceanicoccus sp. KOV_DT_Chl TaxID=1904639 RepID=UPI000C79FC18|nr:PaaI family thioesterase [Oceanicoccus sp. KOV_DT_Chl]
MSDFQPPAGFKPLPLDNSFNDCFAPVYMLIDDDGPRIGMRVEKKHLNSMGIVHGAVYMTLLDIAFATLVGHAQGKYTGTPTININIDYMASTKEGEWLYTDCECLKLSNTMGFTKGIVRSAEEVKVGGSGIFKRPNNLEAAAGMSVDEVRKMWS